MERDVEKEGAVVARPTLGHIAQHINDRFSVAGPPPPPPPKDDHLRPVASSIKRLSFTTTTTRTTTRKIKYGRGKHSKTELSPQPSDDTDDPLNWPQWKKELNLIAILMTSGLAAGMKTAYMSVNGTLAVRFNVSYTAVASLTAVPLVLSAFTGLFSLMASKIWGKRPVYLVSMVFLFIGAIWNTTTANSFGGCMGARVFQGLGWGAFDTLVLGSIQDTFFEHERDSRILAYNLLTLAITWGGPLFGGLASQNADRFTVQFDIINVFQIFSIPLLILGAPETSFERWFSSSPAPTPGLSPAYTFQSLKPLSRPSVEDVKAYLRTIPPVSFSGPRDLRTLLQAPRAFIAPTTLLLFTLTFIPYCTLWGLTEVLSLLFFPMPWRLGPASVGSLMGAPFIFIILTVAGFSLYYNRNTDFTRVHALATLVGGSFLAASGILAFGLKTHAVMAQLPTSSADVKLFATDGVGAQLSFSTLSFLLGLLAAGVAVLDTSIKPLIWRSTQFTSSNLNVCLRNVADMDAGLRCWRNMFAGVFVMTLPGAVVMWSGLKGTVVGLGVSQILVGVAGGVAWWFLRDLVRRLDGRVMGLVDLSILKRSGSFFDTD
ncbi:putative MFS-type transporter [Colletotrichum trifolii]|uniref:Putative MFS-type transporter n=1 Tax=Colletotrichum trifolii TaxID=5466 RepID=A0A4R8QX57_COLTR|nr:putative MFS-type transporter [Colletotrichum trifolii]